MIYIEPLNLKEKNFTSDLENKQSDFDKNKTYKIKDEFIYENNIYACIKESKSENPSTDSSFLKKATSNKMACIDDSIYSTSSKDDEMNISFNSSFGDIIFLQNCNFLDLEIVLKQESKIIYQQVFNMLEPLDIKEYMLGIRDYKKHIVVAIPMSLKSEIYLKMRNPSNIVSIGNIICGRAVSLGLSLAKDTAPSFSFIDLEYFTRDKDGKLQGNKKEVPMSMSINVIHLENKTKNMIRLKKLKQTVKAWLPLTNKIGNYGQIYDPFAIYGALTSLSANLISSLGFDEKLTIESSI